MTNNDIEFISRVEKAWTHSGITINDAVCLVGKNFGLSGADSLELWSRIGKNPFRLGLPDTITNINGTLSSNKL